MERVQSITYVLSFVTRDKTQPLPLSPCIGKQRGLDGTAADLRISRGLYGLVSSQETIVRSANIIGAIFPMAAQLTWRPQFGSSSFHAGDVKA
jgi:hypothetical protein